MMKCTFTWVFILLCMGVNASQAGVCPPRGFTGFLKQALFGKPKPEFSISKYFDERARLDQMKELPQLPIGSSEEMSLAWWESSIARKKTNFGQLQKAYVSVDDVFKNGTETQKQKLMNWARKYFPDPKPSGAFQHIGNAISPSKRLTEKQIVQANLELQLILHDSHLSIPRLKKLGKLEAAERWVMTDFADQVTRNGMIEALTGAGRVEKGNWAKQLKHAVNSPAGKTAFWGPMNALSMTNPWTVMYVYVPKGKLFKLSQKQVEDFILHGEKALPETARKMLAKSVVQSTWNTANEITGHTALFLAASGLTLGMVGYQVYDQNQKRELENEKLIEQDEAEWEEFERQQKEKSLQQRK